MAYTCLLHIILVSKPFEQSFMKILWRAQIILAQTTDLQVKTWPWAKMANSWLRHITLVSKNLSHVSWKECGRYGVDKKKLWKDRQTDGGQWGGGVIQSKEHVTILTCNQRTAPPLRELLSWRRFRYGDPRSPSSPWRSSLGWSSGLQTESCYLCGWRPQRSLQTSKST